MHGQLGFCCLIIHLPSVYKESNLPWEVIHREGVQFDPKKLHALT